MTGKLDWKWIGIGVLIMLALNILGGIVLALALASSVPAGTTVDQIELSGGQVVIIAIVNFLVFLLGGFIVGMKSAGRTIVEPGISAAVAVIVGLLVSGNFSFGNMIAGGIVPFLAGVLGGWLGERRQSRRVTA